MLPKTKTDAWGCEQDHDLWSTEEYKEEVNMRLDMTVSVSLVIQVTTQVPRRSSTSYISRGRIFKGKHFYTRGRVEEDTSGSLVIKRWIYRVEEDTTGFTFQEWDPSQHVDTSRPPVSMVINSSQLCVSVFNLKQVLPPTLERSVCSDLFT